MNLYLYDSAEIPRLPICEKCLRFLQDIYLILFYYNYLYTLILVRDVRLVSSWGWFIYAADVPRVSARGILDVHHSYKPLIL